MENNNRLLFILNPVSGKGKAGASQEEVTRIFENGGWQVDAVRTKCRGHARSIVEECGADYGMVLCCGGDGTFHETLAGIMTMEKRPLMAYIPSGTTNDFAYNLSIPRDPVQAAEAILHGEPFPCDVGGFNDEYFSYTAACGLFTNVTYETSQDMKNLFGKTAYIIEGIKNLANITPRRLILSSDNFVYDEEFLFGMASNSYSIAGMRGLPGRSVAMDDGLLEVVFVKNTTNPVILGEVAQKLLSGKPYHEYIVSFKTRELRIESPTLAPWTLDGEYGGSPSKIVIKALHKAITVIRPAQARH